MRRTACRLAMSAIFLVPLVLVPLGLAAPAQAAVPAHEQTVSADPVDQTPHVLDGEVFAIAVVGDVVVVGGHFTKARNAASGSPVVERTNLLSFDRATGQLISAFHPAVGGEVRTLAPAADGTSVYVGGKFHQVDGRPTDKLARLDVRTGAPVAGFAPGAINGPVFDVELAGSRLFVGGYFTSVGGTQRTRLAELDPASGALRPGVALEISGTAWGGFSGVTKIDVHPDGARVLITGNFRSVGGAERVQIAMLDVSGASATVTDWSTDAYDVKCGRSHRLQYDLRDVSFSPDGSYFVTVATGGKTAPGALCDAVARWDSDRTGPGQRPTWKALTGNDSVYSVALTGSTIYVGGHFRWFNNPYGKDSEGPGAVPREGIAALDPANGLPLTWDPGRARGRAVWDLVATDDALYVGSDTDRIGDEFHARIAAFPLAGGAPVPQPTPPALPADVTIFSPGDHPPGALTRRPDFDGQTAESEELLADEGWTGVRATFRADGAVGRLYVAMRDGTLWRYEATGDAYEDPQLVDLHGLDKFATELKKITSMVLENGQLFYTLKGDRAMYARAFSVQSSVVGAARQKVIAEKSLRLAQVRGGFLTTDGLYVGSRAGTLFRIDWQDGAPVAGSRTPVSGPKQDGIDWSAAGLAAR